MAGFKAAGVVEPLDFDFAPYVKARGVTPEPTDEQIAEFLDGLKKVLNEAKDNLPDDVANAAADNPMALISQLDNLDGAKLTGLFEAMAGVYAKLASGKPSKDQIMGLPIRVRVVYFRWLSGEVMSPEAVTAAGTQPPNQGLRAVGG